MKRLLILALFALSACTNGHPINEGDSGPLYYYHDDVHGVSCWTAWAQSVSCLPDSQVRNPGQ